MMLKDLTVRDVFVTTGAFASQFIKTRGNEHEVANVLNLSSLTIGSMAPEREVVYVGTLSITKDTK